MTDSLVDIVKSFWFLGSTITYDLWFRRNISLHIRLILSTFRTVRWQERAQKTPSIMVMSSFFTTTDRYSYCTTADATLIRLSVSRSVFPSLVNKNITSTT